MLIETVRKHNNQHNNRLNIGISLEVIIENEHAFRMSEVQEADKKIEI